jgi:FKBP-type peptidyl-prolyl cis-trans isomerase FkpA
MSKAAKNDEDVVKVHYTGRFQDGSVFDTSRFEDYAKEEQVKIRKNNPDLFDADGNILKNVPLEFPLNRLIKGWTEGMKLIGPGGKIVLYIPAELAYGDKGAGGQIGANEALEFEIELLDVIPAKK